MIEIRQTAIFTKWIKGLADRRAKLAIAKRIDRLAYGYIGDAKPVGGASPKCACMLVQGTASTLRG